MDNMKLKTIIEDILAINEGWNLYQLESELVQIYDFARVESEGPDRLRFDYNGGRDSMWINDDGTVEGNVPKHRKLMMYLKKHKLKVTGI